MMTQVTKPSLASYLVLVLVTTSLMATSPVVVALTSDVIDKAVITGSTINANVTVGVKAGDWVEYNVTYGGDGDPPESYPIWFRYHITKVQGTNITATLTSEAVNGQITPITNTYDLKTGVLELLVAPAGLNYADVFSHEKYGNITIVRSEEDTYAGGTRTAFLATFDNITVYWDQPTGIFLKSAQEFFNNENQTVTQKVRISATNLWINPNAGPDTSEMDQIVFYAKVLVVIAVLVIIAVLLIRTLRKKK